MRAASHRPFHPLAELLGVGSFQVIVMFRRGLFYSFMAVYLRHFLKLSATETTLFATFPMIANVLCQTFVWGRVSDHFQLRRTMIILGELLAAIGTAALWYVHRMPAGPRGVGYALIAGLSVIEIFWSMSNVAWSALISDLYLEADRAAVQGKLASVGAIGRMAGVWVGSALYDGFGAQYAGWGFHEGSLFFVSAAAMLVSALPMLHVREGGVRTAMAGEPAVDRAEKPASGSARLFVTFLVGMLFIHFGRNSIAVLRVPYLNLAEGFAMSSSRLGYVMNTQSVAMMCFGLLAGRIGRRIGNDRALLAGTVSGIASLVTFALAHRVWMVYAASLLAGVGDVMIFASAYALASALIPAEKRGRLFGIYNATTFLSWGVAGTLIAGPIVDLLTARGSGEVFAYRMSFVAAALLTLVGLAIQAGLSVRTRRARASRTR